MTVRTEGDNPPPIQRPDYIGIEQRITALSAELEGLDDKRDGIRIKELHKEQEQLRRVIDTRLLEVLRQANDFVLALSLWQLEKTLGDGLYYETPEYDRCIQCHPDAVGIKMSPQPRKRIKIDNVVLLPPCSFAGLRIGCYQLDGTSRPGEIYAVKAFFTPPWRFTAKRDEVVRSSRYPNGLSDIDTMRKAKASVIKEKWMRDSEGNYTFENPDKSYGYSNGFINQSSSKTDFQTYCPPFYNWEHPIERFAHVLDYMRHNLGQA